MTELVLKQKHKSGLTRSWRLKPNNKFYSFGTSRFADLISIDNNTEGISYLFLYNNDKWEIISVKTSDLTEYKIIADKQTKLELKSSFIEITPIDKADNLIEKLNKKETQSEYELAIVHHDDRIIRTFLVKASEKPRLNLEKQYSQIKYIPVKTEDIQAYLRKDISFAIADEHKKAAIGIGVFTFLVFTLSFFAPKNQNVIEKMVPPKEISRIIIKPMKLSKPAPAPAPIPQTTQAASEPKSATSAVKSFVGGKLSQLINKVAARVGTTKNVVVTNKGVSAENENSSTAMAALGKLKNNSQDWGNQAKGSQLAVNTSGSGGGRSIAGYGTLANAGTGTAGVGLIEDETEIVGGLDKEVIAQYIKTQLGQILYCYERQLSANPELFGKVAVRFTIGPTGQVEKQMIGDTTLKNKNVEGCILTKVASWKFPAPQGGTSVNVTYPFLFKSTN